MVRRKSNTFNAVVFMIVLAAGIGCYGLMSSSYGHRMESQPDDFVVAIFTAVLGVFAVIQGMFLYRQDKALRESIENARLSNENSAQGVQAAIKANENSEQQSKRELRAYLSLEKDKQLGANGYRRSNEFKKWNGKIISVISADVNYLVVNRGQTPAHNIRWSSRSYLFLCNEVNSFYDQFDKFVDFKISVSSTKIPTLNPGAIEEMVEYGTPYYFGFKSDVADNIYINHLQHEIANDEIKELENTENLKNYSICSVFKLFYSDAFGNEQEISNTYIWDNIAQLNVQSRIYMPGTYST